MLYFTAKKNVELLLRFRDNVRKLWELEDSVAEAPNQYEWMSGRTPYERQIAIQTKATTHPEYLRIRDAVLADTKSAAEIADTFNIKTVFQSFPAPAFGGPIINVHVFDAITRDQTHGGIQRITIWDTLAQATAEATKQAKREYRQLFNPFVWLFLLLRFILRIPFMLFELAGFHVDKVEDHLLAKLFKITEVIVIVLIVVKFKLNKDIGELLTLIKELFK